MSLMKKFEMKIQSFGIFEQLSKLFEVFKKILLKSRFMQGTKKGDIVKASGCCRYKIVEAEE